MSEEERATQLTSSEERPSEAQAMMEPERVTLELTKQKQSHHVFLPAQSGVNKFRFIIDTGSSRSIIQRRFVPARLIRPTSVTEYRYVHHEVKIVGEASVPLTLGTGRASQEVTFRFLVTSETYGDILAMDFLTDFQCELALDAEMRMSMRRRPQEPRDDYLKAHLELEVSHGKSRGFRSLFLVDTGARNNICLKKAKRHGMKITKTVSTNGHQSYKVMDKVVISSGDFSR